MPAPLPPRRLLLLRHAKAGAHDDARDHSRDLAPVSDAQLAAISSFLRDRALLPDHVLCSDALRTRRTWEKLSFPPAAPAPRVEFSSRLYLAEAATLLAVARAVPDHGRTLLMVGHNPGLHALALALAGRARAAARRLDAGLPTAGLVSFTLSDAPWRQLGPDTIVDCIVHHP